MSFTVKKIYRIIFFSAFVIYAIAAYNNHGHIQADEHYQIIEFAALKLGINQESNLAWEYHENIRSSVQPTICFFILKILTVIDTKDPYTQAFILRLITGILAVIIINFFIKVSSKYFDEKYLIPYALLSYFLWFIPVINVRFSSESWAGLTLLLTTAILWKDFNNKALQYFLIGITMAFGFLFRFQMAMVYIGLVLWLLFIKKEKLKNYAIICFSFLLIFFLGILTDFWFYGKPVFTAWNYFKINIINDIASEYGTSSYFYYLCSILKTPSFYIGILLIAALIIFILRSPKNLIVWYIIPFLLLHSIIPHKEERFLIPIANFSAFILIYSFSEYRSFLIRKRLFITTRKYVGYTILVLLIILNTLGLVEMLTKSSSNGCIEISRYIHKHYKDKPVKLYYTSYASPYKPFGLRARFYMDKNVDEEEINTLCDIDQLPIGKNDTINALVIRGACYEDDKSCINKIAENKYDLKISSVSNWILNIDKCFFKSIDSKEMTHLYVKSK